SIWRSIRRISNQYYPITRIWMVSEAIYSIRHPDDFKILLTSPKAVQKGWPYNLITPWLQEGLVTSSGEKWHHRRKILTSAFHFKILDLYIEIVQEHGKNMVQELLAGGQEKVRDLKQLFSKIALVIVCESAMGVSLDKIDKKLADSYMHAVCKFGSILAYRATRPYAGDWMLKYVPFFPISKNNKKTVAILHEFTAKIVENRRKYHETTGYQYLTDLNDNVVTSSNDSAQGYKKRFAMLDLLLDAERKGLIDEAGIKEEVDTFTFAGHDSTTLGLTYSLMLLAENKEAQEKARSEVTQILEQSGGKLGLPELQELRYLECCLKEVLRLYPIVSTVVRYVEEDLELKHATIPKDSYVMCNFFDVNRDPNFWNEPEKFDPSRFFPENIRDRHPFAYLPFSAGPRNCIGQKFAMNELKALVGMILYNFDLEPVSRSENMELAIDIIIRPSKPVYLKFIPRVKEKENLSRCI
ncbi:hypothetical protein QAD02_004539, partial [Eretmocerus hayati]